ncbi:Uncharacterized protein YpmB [Pelagirhabdus alkalitolerans]|uniref:Uncharacterized protein YpmB n=1 Tax=Pelagirhabdus alkalitolerans TaxID=1612202 RepID=A0A1G6HAH7_9BACI|nr:hypothetical protein [Pelagirhabdus alkalitolerans]SDB91088.1 Uncharacterized protein YpmB [Pelagirhabdus alkalitolerans]
MRRNRQAQSFELNRWKIVVLIMVMLFLMVLTYLVYVYYSFEQSAQQGFDETIERIQTNDASFEVDSITRFHGDHHYHVVQGEREGEDLIIFVNQSDDETEPVEFNQEDLEDEEQLLSDWESTNTYQDIHQTNIGIRQNTPLFEIIYRDQQGRLSYDYYRLDTGEYDSGISFASQS